MLQTPLYPFQREDVRRIEELGGRVVVGNEVGLGKTLTALYWAWRFLPADPPGPIVAVVPAHLKRNWSREAERHLQQHVEILDGQTVPPGKRPPIDPNQIYAVNYDILVPPKWNARTRLPDDSWAGWLHALKPRLIILDESHYAQAHDSKRTRALRKMIRGVPHVMALTGTPLKNNVMDLWPVLNMVRPDLFPSRFEFGLAWTGAVRKPWGWEFPGGRNLPALNALLLDTCLIRRRKIDVVRDLPPLIRTVVEIPIDLVEYRKAENDFLAWLTALDGPAALRASAAVGLQKTGHLRRLAGELKVPGVIAWVRDFLESSGEKLLLGATHKRVTRPIVDAFRNVTVLVDGDLVAAEKVRRTDAFNDPLSGVRLCVGNTQSAGTGWNCTVTSDACCIELPWTSAELEQFWGRIYGLNRGLVGCPAHVRLLLADETIEIDICKVLGRKQGYSDQAIDGGESTDTVETLLEVANAMRLRRGTSGEKV